MNVASLQRVDRWMGVPLCFLLTLVRKIGGYNRPQKDIRNILFVKLAEQGSTVLAYPAIRRAAELVGRDNVYFLVFGDNRFILDALAVIPEKNVITISFDSFPSLVRTAIQAMISLRKLKLDAAIDMEFFARGSAAITFLSGAKNRVGFHTYFGEGPYRGNLMTHQLLYNPYWHTTQTFQLMVEALRADPAMFPMFDALPPAANVAAPQFAARPEESAEVESLLRTLSGKAQLPPIILLNPNASDLLPLRRWPTDRYIALAGKLLEKFPETLIGMTGAPNEASAIDKIVARIGSKRCVSLAGKTTLRQLMVLYTIADVLVTNDSGPAHFASLTPIHVVTLFGPETPKLYAARTPRNTSLWAGIACSPCVNAFNNRQSACQDNRCMKEISVEQVFAEVCRAFDAHRAAKSI